MVRTKLNLCETVPLVARISHVLYKKSKNLMFFFPFLENEISSVLSFPLGRTLSSSEGSLEGVTEYSGKQNMM